MPGVPENSLLAASSQSVQGISQHLTPSELSALISQATWFQWSRENSYHTGKRNTAQREMHHLPLAEITFNSQNIQIF